ncbi:MAG TPA: hypothetical protein VEA80_08120 [Vitreimonas sp.]|uniref:hypothetical protein n=1 Tax=Vitreimonas sp. TaxID=3069702 RepID=UPI002D25FB52|nr:hypothetical protein [Vitreimonas sp.]HYD87425.1 hypothetical protein [Vitreimonas sp.]
MRIRAFLGALALGLLAAAPALAQGAEDDGEIVVTGRQLEDAARAFAGAISAPPARENQLPRFNDSICPGVVGLPARQGQYIVDRIAQRALQVGLRVDEPGCQANVLVLVSRDAGHLAATIAEEERYLVANYGVRENLSTRGSEALEDFVATPRPVRWWHVAQTETTDGDVLGHTNPIGRTTGPSTQEFRGAEVTRVSPTQFGRMARPTLQAVRNVVIIVDAERVGGVRLEALSDYLAMVSLAQLDPSADTSGQATILNLFADGAGPNAMTEWDIAYLSGLYQAQANALNARSQVRDIARTMRNELESQH